MELAAAAALPRVLLKRGLELGRAEPDPRQGEVVHGRGQPVRIEPGRARDLERPGRAAALGQVGAFEQHHAGIDDGALQRRQVGRRQHPRQPRLVVVLVSAPAREGQHLDRGPQIEALVAQAGELADGQAVAQGYRKLSHERLVAGPQHRAFDGVAADGVGPVADDHRDPAGRAGLQAFGHRVDVGVDAGADVLQVDDEQIDIGKHRRRGRAGLPVQGVHRHLEPRMPRVVRLDHVVLHVRAEPVLRAEEGGQPDLGRRRRDLDDMAAAGVERGGIRDEADAPTRRPCAQMRRPGGYRHDIDYTGAIRPPCYHPPFGSPCAGPRGSRFGLRAPGGSHRGADLMTRTSVRRM